MLLYSEHKRLPPERATLRRVLMVRHLESWPGLHLPRRPQIGTLEHSAAPGANERRPVRDDPLTRQMELGKSHRRPWYSPGTRVRGQSQDVLHTGTNKRHIHTHTHTNTQPGATTESVMELGAKTPTHHW